MPPLVPEILIADELASGRLAVALDMPLASDAGYYLVAPDAVANDEPFVALSQWLMSLVPQVHAGEPA